MSEKWDFVPEFQPSAGKYGIIGKLSTMEGFEYSFMPVDRAREVSAEIRALGDRYENDEPTVIGWALQWIADDIDAAISKAAKNDAANSSGEVA